MQKKNTTREAWDTAWAWLINTKWGFCVAAIVGAIMTSLFTGISIQLRIIYALCGAVMGIALLVGITWLANIIRITIRHKQDTKAVLSKLREYFSTGEPISEEDITQVSKVVDLNELPIGISHVKTVALNLTLSWEGQSNVIYTGIADKDIITINFAVVGHNYTPNEARVGLWDFSIGTIGYATKNSVFKVFYGNQILGSVSIPKNFMGIFKSVDHSKADVTIGGPYDEIQTRLCKIIKNKVAWEKTLNIPLNLDIGEKRSFHFNL